MLKIFVGSSGEVETFSLIGLDQSAGYTPVGFYNPGIFTPATTQSAELGTTYYQFHKHVSAQLSETEAVPAVALAGVNIPWGWSNIIYRLNNDGTHLINVTGSLFPTHHLYLSTESIYERPINCKLHNVIPQTDLEKFMYIDPTGKEAPQYRTSITITGTTEAQ